ncbi:MAG TPA: multicopper oxidase domain-containing protein [Bryobacteraceae bacterium]|nr:multicopper oxidase domain-containing protein [Bryobacteraceae bacterium]
MTRRHFLATALAAPTLPNNVPKFVDRLSLPPLARPTATHRGCPLYRFPIRQIEQKVHRDLPATTMWGIGSTSPGPTIVARRGQPLFIQWVNRLPEKHLLPGAPEVRTIFHLHGGRVPAASDGYPENWLEPNKPTLTFYPNRQDATLLWYHDHAMSITRLNIMAGLFGLYVVRDEYEDSLNLPSGRYEIPLVLYDRSFRAGGRLSYPASWVPEFSGDTILVNGVLFPYLDIEPRQYRFRLLNASNSRFLYLSLSNQQTFHQIGSDQGLLSAPVALDRVTLAPGERADLLIDFGQTKAEEVILASDRFTILQFRISGHSKFSPADLPKLRPIEKLQEHEAVKTRRLTLEGGGDSDDPTTMNQPMLLNGARWHDPVTETAVLNTVEIWSLINVTDDSHPIHLHLVRFQILDRRSFDVFTYWNERKLRYTSDPIPPDPNEAGWKDTVRADPGMVTRIIVRFEEFTGRYVWHCHVLEHEDYEMMRPYDVVGTSRVSKGSP